jgi:hypothetical protein
MANYFYQHHTKRSVAHALTSRLLVLITLLSSYCQELHLIGGGTTNAGGIVVAAAAAARELQEDAQAGHSSSEYIDCRGGPDVEVAHLQLYVGSAPGARWTLRCNDETELAWDGDTDDGVRAGVTTKGTWKFENLCVNVAMDTCQFTIVASGDTFYALVVGATTIAVSNRAQIEAIDETVCFGLHCDQPPLERDDDDSLDDYYDDDNSSTNGEAGETGKDEGADVAAPPPPTTTTSTTTTNTATRGGGGSGAAATDPNVAQNQNVKLMRQTGFIIWIVSMAITLSMVCIVWYCAARVRHSRHVAEDVAAAAAVGRRKTNDDDTDREESSCERNDEEASRHNDDHDERRDSVSSRD